jgi:hypothetical protein
VDLRNLFAKHADTRNQKSFGSAKMVVTSSQGRIPGVKPKVRSVFPFALTSPFYLLHLFIYFVLYFSFFFFFFAFVRIENTSYRYYYDYFHCWGKNVFARFNLFISSKLRTRYFVIKLPIPIFL